MVLQLKIPNLVNEESLERRVEERARLHPLEEPRQLVAVDQKTSEKEAKQRGKE